MNLFEQVKLMPKVDMHINLVSSISTSLASYLKKEPDILDMENMMQEKNFKDYENSLKIPIEILSNPNNISLAVNDLIDNLEKNNCIYSELFLDLFIYNKSLDKEMVLSTVLNAINSRNYPMQVVLVMDFSDSKEDNMHILDIFFKYFKRGVNGIYFHKSKMTNLNDYSYIFDRLIKNNAPYIINMNSKETSQDEEIYLNANRIIYALPTYDEIFFNKLRKNNVVLEFSLTRFKENKIYDELKNYFLYDIIKENMPLTITSCDMTTMKTDILNEWCILFNNYPLVLHDMYKITNNSLIKANIDDSEKDKLIEELRNKSNLVL